MTPFELGVATWQCRRRVCWTGTGISWMVRMRVFMAPVERRGGFSRYTWLDENGNGRLFYLGKVDGGRHENET